MPETVYRYLRATCGEPVTVERLGGLSRGQVYRARCPRRSVIVKGAARSAEVSFYRTVAPTLAAHAVATPALEWSAQDGETWWLIQEDIPHPLPRERWHADPELLAVLRRLHASEVTPVSERSDSYRPEWSPQMTAAALSVLPGPAVDQLKPLLEALRQEHQHLFTPQCSISGDPNPTNWGVRADGTLVLYDWERFCSGTPALDLAITVPGLGAAVAFQQVAVRYLQAGRRPTEPALSPDNPEHLAHDVSIAKVWSVVEFLSLYASGALRNGPVLDWLVQRFPDWVLHVTRRR